MGPKERRSTVLSAEQEALAVAFRKHTLLGLDDCLYALQATIPHLTRSSLHRLFQRHGISRLPSVEADKPKRIRESCLLSSVSAVAESSPNRSSSQHSSSRSSRLPGLLGDDVGDHMARSPGSDFVSFLYRAR